MAARKNSSHAGHARPCALAIGGLDPGGGAGLLADARAITRAGAFAACACAVWTVQSTAGLRSATPMGAREVLAQCREVARHQRVAALKTGALGTADNVRAVARWAGALGVPCVVDAVLVPTRGAARLLDARALGAMRTALVPRATLVTVNVDEARALVGLAVASLADARRAALALLDLGPRAALVKGGHLSGARAIDVLALRTVRGPRVVEIGAQRIRGTHIHGTGCTLASLVAGRFALTPRLGDDALVAAVRWAKRVHHRAIARAADVGGPQRVLDLA
ncbi:MAG: bifunctional hydroxymethylpyrimidine kinase/phosphomethylpyrimidine kinase [Polyangiaceae bacterium]